MQARPIITVLQVGAYPLKIAYSTVDRVRGIFEWIDSRVAGVRRTMHRVASTAPGGALLLVIQPALTTHTTKTQVSHTTGQIVTTPRTTA